MSSTPENFLLHDNDDDNDDTLKCRAVTVVQCLGANFRDETGKCCCILQSF